jgi:uncharacterized surface protein with fasciclin (FAS1) repeats
MNRTILIMASLVALVFSSSVPAKSCGGSSGSAKRTKASASQPKDIIDTALGAGSFKTLATALTKANLIDTLKGPGPFTVFAPTDAAFKKIPEKDLQSILDDNASLTKILTYHVVPKSLMAADVLKTSSLDTVEGSKLSVATVGPAVKIGNATVTQTDIACSNGVIHVIDTVLVPESK